MRVLFGGGVKKKKSELSRKLNFLQSPIQREIPPFAK